MLDCRKLSKFPCPLSLALKLNKQLSSTASTTFFTFLVGLKDKNEEGNGTGVVPTASVLTKEAWSCSCSSLKKKKKEKKKRGVASSVKVVIYYCVY